MTMEILMNFIAVFMGVILSFSLWFFGEHIIKWREQRKDLNNMKEEIVEEAKFNIFALKGELDYAQKSLAGGDVPLFIPRLRTIASSYAISSGNIRLIKSRRKRFIVRYMNDMYESENRFSENTENLFTILLLRTDGRDWVFYRLKRYAEGITEKVNTLQNFLDKFQQEDLPEDKILDDYVKASNK